MRAVSLVQEWPLIGRDDERTALTTLIRKRQGPGVVLVGAAGAGKSRLATEALKTASSTGTTGLRVTASQAAASIPLGALAPLLPAEVDRVAYRSDAIGWATQAIAAAAGNRPLLVVVDDANLLDQPSAAVLAQLASTGALLVLTARAGVALPQPLDEMVESGQLPTLTVDHLTRAQTAALVESVLGGPVDGAAQRELWEATHGNPLFLREIVLGSLQRRALVDDGGVFRLTGEVRASARLNELIRARLGDLAVDEQRVLDVLAVTGPVDLGLLQQLVESTAIASLVQRGIVRQVGRGDGALLRFVHPLYSEVVRQALTAIRRLAVSRQLADAAEQDAGTDDERVLRVAVWRLDGGGRAQPEIMLAATERALFAYDYPLAERLVRAAVEAGGGVAAQLTLAQVFAETGRHVDSDAVIAGIDPATMTDDELSRATIARAESLVWALDRPEDARAAVEDALARLPDGMARGEVEAVAALHDLLLGSPVDAVARVRSIGGEAEPAGRLLVQLAVAEGPALAVMGRTAEAVAVVDRALAARLELGSQSQISSPAIHLVARSLAQVEGGDIAGSEALARAGYEGAVAQRNHYGQAWFAMQRGRAALVAGSLADAGRLFREGAALFRDLSYDGTRRWCVAGTILAAAMQGDRERVAAGMAELDAVGPHGMRMMEPEVVRARAWAALVGGEPVRARALLADAADVAHDAGSLALETAMWHDVIRVSSDEGAAARLEELAGEVDGTLAAARAHHATALVAGDPEGVSAAAEELAGVGARLLAAEAFAQAASLLRAAGRAGTAATAGARAAELAATCDSPRTPALRFVETSHALTDRERDVAILAARGLPSRDIADRLGLSSRTVDNHLQRVYQKLGVHSRAELAAEL